MNSSNNIDFFGFWAPSSRCFYFFLCFLWGKTKNPRTSAIIVVATVAPVTPRMVAILSKAWQDEDDIQGAEV